MSEVHACLVTLFQTCRSVGEIKWESGEVHVGIIVSTNGLQGLQAEGGSPLAHLAIQIACCLPLRQELFGPQSLKDLHCVACSQLELMHFFMSQS